MFNNDLNIGQRLVGLIFFVFFLLYGWFTGDIQLDFWSQRELFTARTFPYLIAVGGSVAALTYAINPAASPGISLDRRTLTCAAMIVLLLVYGFAIDLLGFPLASVLVLITSSLLLGERRPLPVFAVSTGVVGLIWALLTGLGIHIDAGMAGWILP